MHVDDAGMICRVLPFLLLASLLYAKDFPNLIEDGQARAEIIIAEAPERSVRLAAADLQHYLKKITGVRLQIHTNPTGKVPYKLYIGDSPQTKALGLSSAELQYGAFKIATGKDWMAFLGDNTNFMPTEPWAKNNGDRKSGKFQKAWEEASGVRYGAPNGGMYKNRERVPGHVGKPEGSTTPKNETFEIWTMDERGSFNAVCHYLRMLGVRWYMPGEIGEVIPKMTQIPFRAINLTEKPDFPVRRFNVRFGTASDPTMYWMMRLGFRNNYGMMIAHGMHNMTHGEWLLDEKPEWFALFGGKRDVQKGKRLNHLCYSNPELFQETVKWARAQFDVYNYDTVSIMPPDAYIAICQCELCKGKQIDEMGARGKLSNHVWDFANRVAIETAKTHPNNKILCCAYGANTNPPTNIDKLHPNVQVMVVGGRRPRNTLPDQREAIQKLWDGWKAKTDNPLSVFENYPFTGRGFYLPAFVWKTQIESIVATKGHSLGEDIWLSMTRDFDTVDVGFNHFQVYFTARAYWGGKGIDAHKMLTEYCQKFYGPTAGPKMQKFFEYCEPNYQAMERDKEKVDTALALFDAAKAAAPQGTAYSQRIGLVDDFLKNLRKKSDILGRKRGPVPYLRTVWDPKEPIVIDGKLDDPYWQDCPTASTGRLRVLETGQEPIYSTHIKSGWDRNAQNLYFAIICQEHPDEELNIATTKDDDQAIWYGDVVEILLDTDAHHYYQLAINPAGTLVDLDRGADKSAWFRWQSQAEVATHIGKGFWTAEIRIPVTTDENDPLNQVIGRKPSVSIPWHFNICRQRIRENGNEHSAFSPTGTPSFHKTEKFAKFYDGRSNRFDYDEEYTDYLIESKAARQLFQRRQIPEALAAYRQLANLEKSSDYQKSIALKQAAYLARNLRDVDLADEITQSIPDEAIRTVVDMQNLHAKRQWQELVEKYYPPVPALPLSPGEKAKLTRLPLPFTQTGEGHYLRGRALVEVGAAEDAHTDLAHALSYTTDTLARYNILLTMARNFERNKKDASQALQRYQEIINTKQATGNSAYYTAILNANRLLLQQGNPAKALEPLEALNLQKTTGTWRVQLYQALGDTHSAQGNTDLAVQAWGTALKSKGIPKKLEAQIQEKLKPLSDELE